ncbi:neuropeptide Y receptor-like protein 2 [Leptotrombidium deliense]|uniref:Neuropeptide Y receptor-like protein 2 n=1 Tax=Leptotrombidium deliense TaxID=299467 RepID=A0A443SKC7_9ACAR|nr:neuropeptide Y receptor-like protein 2 [Leptotrombidium deliense]
MVKMMITCVIAFTLCWLPFNTFIVVGDQYPEIYVYSSILYVWFACHWLAMSHACYNPIIYCWMNSRFRSGFKYVLRFMPCVRSTTLPDFLPHCSTATSRSNVATCRNNLVASNVSSQRRINCTNNHRLKSQKMSDNGSLKK